MSENTPNQVKCRKCGGPHFTIKCGKESKPNIFLSNNDNLFDNNPEQNMNYEERRNLFSQDNKKKTNNHDFKKKTYTVKISELPNNITEREIMEFIYDWGNIVKLKVLNYEENSVVYIDFKYEDQADYFVKALHKTKFEYLLISVVRVE